MQITRVRPIGTRLKNNKFGRAKQAQIRILPIKKRSAIFNELHCRNVAERDVQTYRSNAVKHRQPTEV
jgi:hypothetical protein